MAPPHRRRASDVALPWTTSGGLFASAEWGLPTPTRGDRETCATLRAHGPSSPPRDRGVWRGRRGDDTSSGPRARLNELGSAGEEVELFRPATKTACDCAPTGGAGPHQRRLLGINGLRARKPAAASQDLSTSASIWSTRPAARCPIPWRRVDDRGLDRRCAIPPPCWQLEPPRSSTRSSSTSVPVESAGGRRHHRAVGHTWTAPADRARRADPAGTSDTYIASVSGEEPDHDARDPSDHGTVRH